MNNTLKPKIRFKGFAKDWEQCKLKQLCNIFDGIHQTPNYKESGIMFLSVENIKDLKSEKYISYNDFKNNFKIYPEKNDILMTRIGDIGTTNIVKESTLKAYYVSLALLKCKNIDPYYLNYAIKSNFVQNGLKLKSLLTAIPMKINKDQIGEVDINYPIDSKEQSNIGKIFDNLDNLINIHQRKCDKLEELKKSLLEKMFPQKDSKIPEIRFKGFADEWEQRKLGEILKSIPLKDKITNPYFFGKVEVIQQGQVPIAGYSNNNGFNNYKDVVLFGDHTLSLYKPRNPFLVASDGVKAFCCDFMYGDYLHIVLEKNLPKNEGYKRYSSILKEQNAKYTFNQNEQIKLGELFNNIDNLITLHQRKHDKLNKIKQSLLNDMFV